MEFSVVCKLLLFSGRGEFKGPVRKIEFHLGVGKRTAKKVKSIFFNHFFSFEL